ncbi:MAG: hypothetical protein IJU61_00360 [Victivallales bacterium]|nr:hypothetical protein [Victivallales bacterium]
MRFPERNATETQSFGPLVDFVAFRVWLNGLDAKTAPECRSARPFGIPAAIRSSHGRFGSNERSVVPNRKGLDVERVGRL